MNRKGQDGEMVFGLILTAILGILVLYGFFSANICNRLLIVVGITGLMWLYLGTPLITKIEHSSGWVFFLPLSVLTIIIWIILNSIGICPAATNLWQALQQVWQ